MSQSSYPCLDLLENHGAVYSYHVWLSQLRATFLVVTQDKLISTARERPRRTKAEVFGTRSNWPRECSPSKNLVWKSTVCTVEKGLRSETWFVREKCGNQTLVFLLTIWLIGTKADLVYFSGKWIYSCAKYVGWIIFVFPFSSISFRIHFCPIQHDLQTNLLGASSSWDLGE